MLKTKGRKAKERCEPPVYQGYSSGYHKRLKCSRKAYVKKAEFEKFILKASVETLATVLRRIAVLSQAKVHLLWRNPAFPSLNFKGSMR